MDATPPKPPADTARLRTGAGPLLALLMAMTAIGPLSLNILVPATPGLVATLKTDPATVQLTVSLYLLGLAVSQLALGPLSDRFGRRPVVLCGLLVTVVSSFVALFASSIGEIILARTIQAFGASTGLVIGRAIIRDLYERERAAAMIGWVATVMVVAPMVTPLIGGILDTAFGWEATFVFVGVYALLVLFWSWTSLQETRPDHVTSGGLRFLVRETRALFKSRAFNAYVLAATLGSATFFAFLGGSPHVVIELMGESSAAYGAWFIITAFGYMLGNFAAANLSPRFGIDTMIRAGLGIELLGALVTILAVWLFPFGGPATIFPTQFLVSFGNGTLLPSAIAGAVSVRPQAAGTASGIVGCAQMAVGALAAQGTSWIVAGSMTALPMAFTILLIVLAAIGSYAVLMWGIRD
ncbi:MAG: multidrug effflux MFS transporter [Pseudorhodoplanes sp.]|nr:multidrug effflux MFS transporter [Pseudorhodoplanes sp.]